LRGTRPAREARTLPLVRETPTDTAAHPTSNPEPKERPR